MPFGASGKTFSETMVDIRKTPTFEEAPSGTPGTTDPALPRTVYSLSEDETLDLGRTFARQIKGGELLALEGDLGLGKTVFVRGFASGLGIAPQDVASPSFTLVQEHPDGRLPLYHVDLYRLDNPDDVEPLGLEELMASGGVVVVEWGEKLPSYFRRDALVIRFHDVGEGSRRIELLPDPRAPRKRRNDA